MKPCSSPYYPPRARWYGRWRYPWNEIKRALRLDGVSSVYHLNWIDTALALLVPGYIFHRLRFRKVGAILLAFYLTGAVLFFWWIGYSGSILALGAMVGTHVTSLSHYLAGFWDELNLKRRIILSLTSLLIVYGLIYRPLQNYVETRLAMPVRVGDCLVIIRPGVDSRRIQRGETLACRIEEFRSSQLVVMPGLNLGTVLGLPGDHLEFHRDRLEVNGQAGPRQTHMPVQGGLVLPEKNWFIWPRLLINNSRVVTTEELKAALLQTAMINESQLIGRPYRHWFGRKQVLP